MRFGKRIEIVGGLVLISIGLRIVIEHLAGKQPKNRSFGGALFRLRVR